MSNDLPNCLVVGPRKAGTSWLYEYLKDHGDFALPAGVKETFFFDRYHPKGLGWYRAHFRDAGDSPHIIEVAPTYFEDEGAPERIREALGPIPVVCTFRDPVERTYSLYQHLRRYGETRLPFREAVEREGLITGSLYAKQLAHWRTVFGEDRVAVVYMEDLAVDADGFVREITDFLGARPVPVPDRLRGKYYEAANSPNFMVAKAANIVAQGLRSLRLYGLVNALRDTPLKGMIFGKPDPDAPKDRIDPADRRWLLETYLEADITRLEGMTGRSFDRWRRKGD